MSRASWSFLVEECPSDCLERVLGLLQPADVAACRLVCRAWRREVGLLLQQLQPAAGTDLETAASTFPHLAQLTMVAGSSSAASSRCGSGNGGAGGAGAAGGDGSRLPPPHLGELPQRLRRLRVLRLQGLRLGRGLLDCRSLLPLAGMPALHGLEAASLQLHHAAALQHLRQLTRLRLEGSSSLGGWPGTLPELLLPLNRLAHLHFSSMQPQPAAGAAGGGAAAGPAIGIATAGGAGVLAAAGQLAGLRQLFSLVCLELSCWDAASDAACLEVAALPLLESLAITRSAGSGSAAPSITDAGLAALCQLGRQLSSLKLSGHTAITDEGVRCLAQLTKLQHLQLCLAALGPQGLRQAEVTDDRLQAALSSLTRLQSLHLGGACHVGEATCAAVARRLPHLASLALTDCASLADVALFRLAPLAPALRQLALAGCSGITDIGLAALLKGAGRLTSLDLAGCHRNITGVGLAAGGSLRHLRRLTHLNLAGCEAITEVQLEALLPAARSLEHLDLRDCCVSDRACALLAAHMPSLQWLSLEHCPRVSDAGLRCLAAALPRLHELHLFGSGATLQAAAQLQGSPAGRRLRLGMHKHCWWLAALERPVGGPGHNHAELAV